MLTLVVDCRIPSPNESDYNVGISYTSQYNFIEGTFSPPPNCIYTHWLWPIMNRKLHRLPLLRRLQHHLLLLLRPQPLLYNLHLLQPAHHPMPLNIQTPPIYIYLPDIPHLPRWPADLWHVVANITLILENTGPRSGAEIPQLYLEYPAAANQPVRQLRGFERVLVGKGERVSKVWGAEEGYFSLGCEGAEVGCFRREVWGYVWGGFEGC